MKAKMFVHYLCVLTHFNIFYAKLLLDNNSHYVNSVMKPYTNILKIKTNFLFLSQDKPQCSRFRMSLKNESDARSCFVSSRSHEQI